MDGNNKRTEIDTEFFGAHGSRAKGNEGRARVHARRAAGLAIGIYFKKLTGKNPPQSAYKLLEWFSQREEIPEDLQLSAGRLTVRVTPEFELPHEEDPIDDARKIVTAILSGGV